MKEEGAYFALLMEKAEGSLRDVIHPDTPQMSELRTRLLEKMSPREIIRQIFCGMAYIHSRTDDAKDNISHRDVKPENLLAVALERDGSIALKFADFDSAKKLQVDQRVAISSRGIGTSMYLDPHICFKRINGQMVIVADYLAGDVYACGMVAYELLTSEHLFKGETNTVTLDKMRVNDRRNLFEAAIDELLKNTLMAMTQKKPEDRPTMDEVLNGLPFLDDNDHLQHFNAINEAIIDLDSSPESQISRKALINSFFMVFDEIEWKKLPYVVDSILNRSKYDNTMLSLLRYCRNLVTHAGQHKEALQKHFGTQLSAEELLRKIIEGSPRMLIHIYWFAKRHLSHLPQLKFLSHFPTKCADAYEQLMEGKRKKIGVAGLGRMFLRLCRMPEGVVAVDENAIMEDSFNHCLKQIIPILDRSESDFKAYKEKVKKWERDKSRLEKKVANLRKNDRPRAETDAAETELESLKKDMEKQLQYKWMLDFRDDMRNPEKYQASKSRLGCFVAQCWWDGAI